MNIGIDMRLCGNRNGGIGRYSFEIARHVLELDTHNRYVLFFNKKATDPEDIHYFSKFPNTEIVITTARHYSIAEQTSFLRTLNKYNLDVVHFPNFNVPIFYKRPFIVTVHDVVHHKLGGAKKTHLLHFFAYKKVIEQAVKNAKKIITVSEFSKQDIAKVFSAAPEKIEVIYEGPTLTTTIAEAQVEKVKKQYLLKKPYFLFVGVLERKKNVVNLTRAFDVFIKKYHMDMDLVIVGKTDKHYPEIKHHALDISNNNRLVFTGYVEDSELEALYRGAYAYSNISLHEGFGLPGVEAMQFGLPLIVSNIPVFNEIYDNAAVYCDPLDVNDVAEKMHLVARDQQFYSQLRKNSIARAGMFNWQDAAQKTLEVYKSIPMQQLSDRTIS
jgi:glycosyltransferase involved in cell wall biosynthesis